MKVPVIDTDGEIVLKDKRSKIQLSEDGQTSLKTESKSIIGAINELADLESCKTKVINFKTSNIGVKLDIGEGEVIFVQVQKRFIDGVKNTGNIAIGYHEDGMVGSKNEFIVHVESKEEIAMKALIYYR